MTYALSQPPNSLNQLPISYRHQYALLYTSESKSSITSDVMKYLVWNLIVYSAHNACGLSPNQCTSKYKHVNYKMCTCVEWFKWSYSDTYTATSKLTFIFYSYSVTIFKRFKTYTVFLVLIYNTNLGTMHLQWSQIIACRHTLDLTL